MNNIQLRILAVNQNRLLDLIDPNNAFVTELANVKCISWPQRNHINQILQERERSSKLLEFLTRRSMVDYERFINVLSKEQAHVVRFFVIVERESNFSFLPRDSYAKRGICRRRVSVCLCVCLCVCVSVCLSHSGIVSKRLNVGSHK